MARKPEPRPRRRDAVVIVALLLVAATLWLTVLGPMGGRSGWLTLLAVALLLGLLRLLDPWIRAFSRWVSGKRRRPRP